MLDPRSGAGHRCQCSRIHDLVGRSPYFYEVPDGERIVIGRLERLPVDHRLVHLASVEISAEFPLEIVYEGEHLFVGHALVKVAILIGRVAIERHDCRVHQLDHCCHCRG